ncbi:MAG: hypothetical protein ABIB79_02160 [archaeon]
MELELINPHVLKILIAIREEDSINAISNRTSLSYGWTHKWVNELARLKVVRLTRMKVFLNNDSEFYKKTLDYVKQILSKKIKFHYEVLSLFGIKYSFTQTDSVFIWTKGGYNIARYGQYYPIFIKIRKKDKELFEFYCEKLNFGINRKKGVFYNVNYLEDFDVGYCDKIPVDSIKETISFMEKNIYNFEPALEMIKEMYKKKLKIQYKEVATNV